MSLMVASASALSVSANSTSAEQVSGTYETVSRGGTYTLIAKSSATGITLSSNVGGQELAGAKAVPYTGTAGTLSAEDNVMFSQFIPVGGKSSVKFSNTTGGTLTVDFILWFDPA